jgi:hypothetical protein
VSSGTTAFVVLGSVAFIFGLRGSIRLTRRYVDVSVRLVQRERAILGSFVVVAWLITIGAGFFDAVAARRLLGFTALDWTPVASIVIASLILFIPAGLDYVVDRVARVPWR